MRSAETLRGTLVRCGPGHRLASWPETPRVRLAALAPWSDEGVRIAALLTAAWVWGATRSPGSPLDFTARKRRPFTGGSEVLRLHQFTYDAEDIVGIGSFRVTSPERTALDLLRFADPFTSVHRVACRLLLTATSRDRTAIEHSLNHGRRQHRATARTRLREL